jgi:hypothetical protein
MAGARITTRPRRASRPSPKPAAPSSPSAVLGGLPPALRKELLDELNKIAVHYREGRWEPAELDAGRLTEVAYSIVKGHLDGKMPAKAYKPKQMVQAIQKLEGYPASAGPRSMRVTIPRVLLGVLDIRNDRDVGHVGAEVSSNHMDATYVLGAAKWLVAELVRVFHQVDVTTATEFVEALIERETPAVWAVAGVKRVILAGASMSDRVLLLLDSTAAPVLDMDLRIWAEYSNLSVFRRKVLGGLHDENMLHYDRKTGLVHLSPIGARYVSTKLGAFVP